MLKAYSWLTLCVIVWGSNFIFGKILVQTFSPTVLTMLRLFFIVLLLVGITSYKKLSFRIEKSELVAIIPLGVVGVFINHWSFYVGLQTADPTISALILATTPIVTSFLAAIFLKERLTIQMLVGSVIAFTGIFFVVTKGNISSIHVDKGLGWIVVTMVSFAIMIIMTRKLSNKVDPLKITLHSNIIGFVVAIPFAFLLDNPLQVSYNISDWALLIGTAITVHGLANLIWNTYIRYVDASKASILSNLEPFVAMVVGFIILHKPITWLELLGSVFIVGGVLISTIQMKKFQKLQLDKIKSE